MSIHTFGDSHSSVVHSGWKDCKNIKAHHLGPILCYSFGREKLNRCNVRNYGVKDKDTVIFCFGEIDCRCHVHKHITEARTYKMVIDDIVKNYIDAIRINVEELDLKVCIYNVVPPVQKHNTNENPDYPYLGSDEERKLYALYFNECLKDQCEKNNWIYFDIYNSYTDQNGFLSKKLSDGNVHIKDGTYMSDFINKYLS